MPSTVESEATVPPSSTSHVRDALGRVLERHTEREIPLGDIFAELRDRGFGVLLFLFAAPVSLPLPAVGVSMIFALPMMIFAWQMARGWDYPHLPAWLAKKRMQRKTLALLAEKLDGLLRFMERFLKPRLRQVTSPAGERLIGVCILLFAFCVALPIPFSNTVPSMGIVVIAFGLLERDGLAILAGIGISVAGITLMTLGYLMGIEALKELLGFG